jgi:hypothetical protein
MAKRLFTKEDYLAGLRPKETREGIKIYAVIYSPKWNYMVVTLEDGGYYVVDTTGRFSYKESISDAMIEVEDEIVTWYGHITSYETALLFSKKQCEGDIFILIMNETTGEGTIKRIEK